MPTPNRKRYRLEEMRAQAIDSLEMEPGIDLELDNGEVVTVPNPLLVDDGVQELIADNKLVDAVRLILGPEDHARLLAHGGRSNDVMLAWRLMKEDLDLDSKSG